MEARVGVGTVSVLPREEMAAEIRAHDGPDSTSVRTCSKSSSLHQHHCVGGYKVQSRDGFMSDRCDSMEELQGGVVGLFQGGESAATYITGMHNGD